MTRIVSLHGEDRGDAILKKRRRQRPAQCATVGLLMSLLGATRATAIAFIAAGMLRVQAGALPQAPPDLAELVRAVAERIANYYQRAERDLHGDLDRPANRPQLVDGRFRAGRSNRS